MAKLGGEQGDEVALTVRKKLKESPNVEVSGSLLTCVAAVVGEHGRV